MPKIKHCVAVDFDGTIVADKYPEYGEVNQDMVEVMNECRNAGYKVMIYTCRVNRELYDSDESWAKARIDLILFLDTHKIPYDFIYQKEKPVCVAYIDDRAISTRETNLCTPEYVLSLIKKNEAKIR